MATSHFLVQWMPGPCTEAGPDREFSLISLDDIKEDYRYALECGRITMATYRFTTGSNTGSMHRLCKILGSGERTTLETEMISVMGTSSGQPSGQESGQSGSGEDEITCILKVEEDLLESTEMNVDQTSQPVNQTKYPPWEVQQEMIALLDENHQIQRENEILRKKLAKAVDVMDLRNILQTTIVNIEQKQITQPTHDAVIVPSSSGSQSNKTDETIASLTSLEEDPIPVLISSANISAPSVSMGVSRPTASRQTPPTTTTYQQQPRQAQVVNAARQQTRPSPSANTTFQQQARTLPVQQQARAAPVQQQATPVHEQQQARPVHEQQQARPTPVQQQARPAPGQLQQSRPTPVQQQARPVQIQQQQVMQVPQVQQKQAVQLQQVQQQQVRQLPIQHEQQQRHILPASGLPPQQSHQMMAMQSEEPYIVNVQSLADPTVHPAGQVQPTGTDQPGPSGTARMGAYPRTSQRSHVPTGSQQIGVKRQRVGGKHRQIRPPQWQSSYVTEGVQNLQGARSGPDLSPTVCDVIEIPTTSTQRPPPVTGAQQTSPQRMMSPDYDDDSDKMVELVPGMGVKLPRRQLRMAQKTKGFSQYTRNLMMLVFSMKELSVCSVTGYKATGRGSENAVARPALDQTRVHAIIAAVQRRFPSVSHFKVKQTMGQKIMDHRRKIFRSKKKFRNPVWKRSLQQHSKIKDLIS